MGALMIDELSKSKPMLKRYKKIYVEQFGGWWSFSPDDWVSFLEETIADLIRNGVDGGHVLPEDKQIKRKPPCAYNSSCDHREEWCSINKDYKVIKILDWEFQSYVEMLSIFKCEISEHDLYMEDTASKIIDAWTDLYASMEFSDYSQQNESEYTTVCLNCSERFQERKKYCAKELIQIEEIYNKGTVYINTFNKMIKEIIKQFDNEKKNNEVSK